MTTQVDPNRALFKNPEILDCRLCFERFEGLCPEHKLQMAFKADSYLEECVELLIKDRLLDAAPEAKLGLTQRLMSALRRHYV